MKKALLILVLIIGAKQLKAQQYRLPKTLPYTLQLQHLKPVDTIYNAFKTRPKVQEHPFNAVPFNLPDSIATQTPQLLADRYDHMPILRTYSDDPMPIYHEPDTIHYHMRIIGFNRVIPQPKVNQ